MYPLEFRSPDLAERVPARKDGSHASFIPVDVARVAMILACELWTRSLNNALAAVVVAGEDSSPHPGGAL